MIQAFYQALQTSVSWERVSEIQSTKETTFGKLQIFSACRSDKATSYKPWIATSHVNLTTRLA